MSRTSSGPSTARRTINQVSLLLHLRKTTMLISAVLHDARVHPLRKAAFVGSLGTLLALVLFPEAAADAGTLLIPVLNFIGIPIEVGAEAGLDWMVFGVAAFNLLRLFPADIVGEHYDRLFRKH